MHRQYPLKAGTQRRLKQLKRHIMKRNAYINPASPAPSVPDTATLTQVMEQQQQQQGIRERQQRHGMALAGVADAISVIANIYSRTHGGKPQPISHLAEQTQQRYDRRNDQQAKHDHDHLALLLQQWRTQGQQSDRQTSLQQRRQAQTDMQAWREAQLQLRQRQAEQQEALNQQRIRQMQTGERLSQQRIRNMEMEARQTQANTKKR